MVIYCQVIKVELLNQEITQALDIIKFNTIHDCVAAIVFNDVDAIL